MLAWSMHTHPELSGPHQKKKKKVTQKKAALSILQVQPWSHINIQLSSHPAGMQRKKAAFISWCLQGLGTCRVGWEHREGLRCPVIGSRPTAGCHSPAPELGPGTSNMWLHNANPHEKAVS